MEERNITMSDLSHMWLADCQSRGLERATLRSYRNHVDCHIAPILGSALVKDVTAPVVQRFVVELRRQCSEAMVKKVLCSLRQILGFGICSGFATINAAREVKVRRSSRHVQEREIPTKAEIMALLGKAKGVARPLLCTAVFTGMRASELRGLRWDNVDLERRVIRVCERVDRFNEFGAPKSRSSRRTIPIGSNLLAELKAWRDVCPKGALNLVFPNGAGNVESHWNMVDRLYKRIQVECGIVNEEGKAKYGFHALRHAAASLFIEQGWQPKKIQAFLGHSSITMTFDVYGHLFNDASNDTHLMDKLESSLLAA